jgi:hypothetical protein
MKGIFFAVLSVLVFIGSSHAKDYKDPNFTNNIDDQVCSALLEQIGSHVQGSLYALDGKKQREGNQEVLEVPLINGFAADAVNLPYETLITWAIQDATIAGNLSAVYATFCKD